MLSLCPKLLTKNHICSMCDPVFIASRAAKRTRPLIFSVLSTFRTRMGLSRGMSLILYWWTTRQLIKLAVAPLSTRAWMKVLRFPLGHLSSTGMDNDSLDCLLYTRKNSLLGYRNLVRNHVVWLEPFIKRPGGIWGYSFLVAPVIYTGEAMRRREGSNEMANLSSCSLNTLFRRVGRRFHWFVLAGSVGEGCRLWG
jgi:hypothetical protein